MGDKCVLTFRHALTIGAIVICSVLIWGCGHKPSFDLLSSNLSRNQSGSGTDGSGDPTDPTSADDSCSRMVGSGTEIVVMCHVPPGNPAAKHTICPALPGAVHGHGVDPSNPAQTGGHGGDYLGPC
jgi:hypothetical protein